MPQSVVAWGMALHCPEPLASCARFLADSDPSKLERLGDIYSPGIHFHDPLCETRGLRALRESLICRLSHFPSPLVTVIDSHGDDRSGFLLWTLTYRDRGQMTTLTACSHVRLAPDGRVAAQRDYWDASFALYGRSPWMTWLLSRLRKHLLQSTQMPTPRLPAP